MSQPIDTVLPLLQATLTAHVDPSAQLQSATLRPKGAQGYSGATLNYYDILFARPNKPNSHITLVTKDAPLNERLAVQWLGRDNSLAVPFSFTFDNQTDAPALICYQYLTNEANLLPEQQKRLTAQSLAAIHAANHQASNPVPGIPLGDQTLLTDWIDIWWRKPWLEALQDEAFAAAFSQYTNALEAAAVRYLAAMEDIWRLNDSLTLIHADFHSEHVLMHEGRAYIIDWGNACFGSWYLDLPNYFSPEEVVIYRQALATHGIVIPDVTFAEAYHEASRYFGFKYFGIGIWLWQANKPERDESMRYWLNAAIHGR